MKRVMTAVAGCALALTGCSVGVHSQPSLPDGAEWQAVDNEALLKHVDEQLADMPDEQKLNYLALQGCAAEIGMMGIYGTVDDNPLMERWNELNDRYNRIWEDAKAKLQPAGVPANLTYAEDALCRGDHPVG